MLGIFSFFVFVFVFFFVLLVRRSYLISLHHLLFKKYITSWVFSGFSCSSKSPSTTPCTTPGTPGLVVLVVLRMSYLISLHPLLFKFIAHVRSICKFDLTVFCVFVFLYLHVRHLGTLFLKSSYHYLLKNISHVRSIFKFDSNCICRFVYMCICICVFGCQTSGNIVFEVLVRFPFQKYITSWVFLDLAL